MNRTFTNKIRWIMDELLPAWLRNNYFFMYPFFYYWFKGKNIDLYMRFKTLVKDMTETEIREVYQELDCRAKDRATDLNEECLRHIISRLDQEAETLVDLGCGRGFFLQEADLQVNRSLRKYGLDLTDSPHGLASFHYINGDLRTLPFADHSVDIVTCFHTLEHLRDLHEALSEIKRIARKQVIIVVPRQRYFYYSLDLHLHFFPAVTDLTSCIDFEDYTCEEVQGDWVYIGRLQKS